MAKRGKSKAKGKQPAKAAEPVIAVATPEPVVEQIPEPAAEFEAAPAMDDQAETAPASVSDVAEADPAQIEPAAEASPAKASRPSKPQRKPKVQARDQRPPFLVLADYEQRSLAHVAGLPEQLDAPGLWRGVAYRIGSHRLASGFDEVVEILSIPALTTVPGAQPWMLGVANVRGTLLPVVDLKQFLEGERTVLHESQRVLVVRQPGGEVAVTIDELYGQRSFVDGQGIDTAQVSEGRYGHFIDRAYRMGEQDWGVFSLDRLARTPEFRQAAA
jgi:twitching motility protein PilI